MRTTTIPSTTHPGHRLTAVGAATVVSLVAWTAVHGNVEGVDIGTGSVLFSTLVATLCGWAVLEALERLVRPPSRAMRIWWKLAVAFTVISLAGPLTVDAPTSTQWSLVALHTSVAAAFIAAMVRPRRGRS